MGRANRFRWTALALATLALAGASTPLAAQYFGQNKVRYRAFDFKIIQTEHFDLYYYDDVREAALDASRMAERTYARLSRILNHRYQGRKPIILYGSYSEFQQTNIGDIGEGTEGVTEFFKHRMVLPFTGSYAQFEHVLQHEMAHQFQYDIFARGRVGAGLQTLIQVNPPLWFMEGMAEYLSVGPIDIETAMWMRDAAVEGHLPTIEQLTYDPSFFPYRFGHALWSYIGERWGDEAIGAILHSATASGDIEGAFRRVLGLDFEDFSAEWRDALQTTYLPQLADHYRARRVAQPLLNRRRSGGTLHFAPALSPDGQEVIYFSERNSFFIDLYLADARTGRVKRKLLGSVFNTNFESLRFIYSAGSWSPDGRFFALAVGTKGRDDLVILDIRRGGREVRRIKVPVSAITTPSWSPDGRQLVFVGYDGGRSDLFLINADGTDLRRLTHDRYADLHPAWAPDGRTIAFATDRGPGTDFDQLRFGQLKLALYRLDGGAIEILPHMDAGRNINPQWSPDGRAIAFVSDRTGISNLFLLELADNKLYQLTDLYTGIAGITPFSPVLSWARQSDKLAFTYYEDGTFDVYGLDAPRSLRREPYRPPERPIVISSLLGGRRPADRPAAAGQPAAGEPGAADTAGQVASVYRSAAGFRQSAAQPVAAPGDTTPAPISVRQLLDSTRLALPDTSEFTFRGYKARFTPDYIARPSIGYERDNYGRGFSGGTAISLSDMLGNHNLIFAGQINGRLVEAQVLAAYINMRRRLNWAVGFTQDPYYIRLAPSIDSIPSGSSYFFEITDRYRRLVVRDLFLQASYPFSRFRRVEFGIHGVNVDDDIQELIYDVDPLGFPISPLFVNQINLPSINFAQPSLALVDDKSLFGWVGPFAGHRSRLQVAPTFGDWQFTELVGDYRRYVWFRPFTFAMRYLYYGRVGRDGQQFPLFIGSTELIRGYTWGSFRENECDPNNVSYRTGCAELDQLIGSQVAVANFELRFPLFRSVQLGLLPVGLPPVEAALFYDLGVAYDQRDQVVWQRDGNENPALIREVLRSYGASVRVNLANILILRFDYTKPVDRPQKRAYWTVSLGPTF